MSSAEIKKRIAKLKKAGIQNSALAKRMKMSPKVFSTRLKNGFSADEILRMDPILRTFEK